MSGCDTCPTSDLDWDLVTRPVVGGSTEIASPRTSRLDGAAAGCTGKTGVGVGLFSGHWNGSRAWGKSCRDAKRSLTNFMFST